jgi:hypothetical protein
MYLVNHTHRQLILLPANAEYKLFQVVSHTLKTLPNWTLDDDVEMYDDERNDTDYDYIYSILANHSYAIKSFE